jgi:flavin-dependent thymidylate synthase
MNNTVELIGYYGSDLSHSLSAWTSTSRDLTPEKIVRIPKLLEMLRNGSDGQPHGTPFEKSSLHFLVTSDLSAHIHALKHRIAVSINTESARYKELNDDKAYIPVDWPDEWKEKLQTHINTGFNLYHECLDSLVKDHGMDRKRAKESARFFNSYATQLTCDIMFNFRSFVHFCGLRGKPGAQKEIRDITLNMIKLVHEIPGKAVLFIHDKAENGGRDGRLRCIPLGIQGGLAYISKHYNW